MNEQILDCLREVFERETPFSNFLGIRIISDDTGRLSLFMERKDVCIGNYIQNILHGGIIATLLDIMGAVVAVEGVLMKMENCSRQEMMRKFEKLGTIDMRVDYLRPGRGISFTANGEAMRVGNKVSVVRTELRNNDNVLIAVGTGTYMVG